MYCNLSNRYSIDWPVPVFASVIVYFCILLIHPRADTGCSSCVSEDFFHWDEKKEDQKFSSQESKVL